MTTDPTRAALERLLRSVTNQRDFHANPGRRTPDTVSESAWMAFDVVKQKIDDELAALASAPEPAEQAAQAAVEADLADTRAKWPPMGFGDGRREGEPQDRRSMAWLAWFCGKVYQHAYHVPPGDARYASELAAELAGQAASLVDMAKVIKDRDEYQVRCIRMHQALLDACNNLYGFCGTTGGPVDSLLDSLDRATKSLRADVERLTEELKEAKAETVVAVEAGRVKEQAASPGLVEAATAAFNAWNAPHEFGLGPYPREINLTMADLFKALAAERARKPDKLLDRYKRELREKVKDRDATIAELRGRVEELADENNKLREIDQLQTEHVGQLTDAISLARECQDRALQRAEQAEAALAAANVQIDHWRRQHEASDGAAAAARKDAQWWKEESWKKASEVAAARQEADALRHQLVDIREAIDCAPDETIMDALKSARQEGLRELLEWFQGKRIMQETWNRGVGVPRMEPRALESTINVIKYLLADPAPPAADPEPSGDPGEFDALHVKAENTISAVKDSYTRAALRDVVDLVLARRGGGR